MKGRLPDFNLLSVVRLTGGLCKSGDPEASSLDNYKMKVELYAVKVFFFFWKVLWLLCLSQSLDELEQRT